MGILDKEEEEDFEHKMHDIEMEMLSEHSRELTKGIRVNSEDHEEDNDELVSLKRYFFLILFYLTYSFSNSIIEEVSLNIEEENNDYTIEHKKESIFRKIYNMIAFNQAMKIILTIFVTEMGDRSQISAVGLAAQYPVWIVAFAGSIGHIFALILAILFGRAVSDYTTEK